MKSKTPAAPALPQRLSLVAQTVQSLRAGIQSGHWQTFLPGERKLCDELQVCRATMRAALRELENKGWFEVTERQRRRIKGKRAAATGSNHKKEIGILCAFSLLEMPTPLLCVLEVVRDAVAKAGCTTKLHVNRACFSAHPARALAEVVEQSPAAAWLLFGSTVPTQSWFERQQLPCLIVGSCAPGISLPSMDANHRAACHHAGGMLLRKGHRRVALVLPQGATGGDADSEQGLREALASSSRADIHLRVLHHNGSTAHLCSLLDEALRLPDPPTAILVARAKHVLTVVMHLLRRGRRIPQDVAVISRDDDPFFQYATPTVARYAIDQTQFAHRLAMASRQLAETGALPAHAIRQMPEFIGGETL
jgi:DNA-binding LacI/PurR family transcriptional regulator